ncbi:MAG: SDR family NAD(P)-dependent oxidoreductase [Pseudomonadota bacterium]
MTASEILVPGRRALVTGAAGGIGSAAVRLLAAAEMEVVAVDLPSEALAAQASMPRVTTRSVDVSDAGAMSSLAKEVGPVDLLMSNAATRAGKGFDAPRDEWRMAFDVNFWGVVNGVDAFLPGMQAAGRGMIVNVGSKQGITNPPGHPVYNATKAALKSYTESLEHMLREAGGAISAHLLIPGFTLENAATRNAGAWEPEQVVERMIEGLKARSFYILCPDNEVTPDMDARRIAWAAGDITEDRPPLSRWHAAWRETAAKACN